MQVHMKEKAHATNYRISVWVIIIHADPSTKKGYALNLLAIFKHLLLFFPPMKK